LVPNLKVGGQSPPVPTVVAPMNGHDMEGCLSQLSRHWTEKNGRNGLSDLIVTGRINGLR